MCNLNAIFRGLNLKYSSEWEHFIYFVGHNNLLRQTKQEGEIFIFHFQAAVFPQKNLPNHRIHGASLVIKNKLLHILLWEDNLKHIFMTLQLFFHWPSGKKKKQLINSELLKIWVFTYFNQRLTNAKPFIHIHVEAHKRNVNIWTSDVDTVCVETPRCEGNSPHVIEPAWL